MRSANMDYKDKNNAYNKQIIKCNNNCKKKKQEPHRAS